MGGVTPSLVQLPLPAVGTANQTEGRQVLEPPGGRVGREPERNMQGHDTTASSPFHHEILSPVQYDVHRPGLPHL